jgi:hypothetical protein
MSVPPAVAGGCQSLLPPAHLQQPVLTFLALMLDVDV